MTKNNWKKMPYANTEVNIEESQIHISLLLSKYNIVDVQNTFYQGIYTIRFIYESNAYQLNLDLSNIEHEQQKKQKFRAFYWYLKSRLEGLQFGINTFHQEFALSRIIKMGDKFITIGDLIEEQKDRLEYGQGLFLPYR